MILDRGCYERGCACFDDRIDKDGVEVFEMTPKERAVMQQAVEALEELADAYRMDINSEFETHANPDLGGNALEYKQAVEAITALREALKENEMAKIEGINTLDRFTPAEQADMNLNCKSVQARLAASWGYVKAEQAEQEPVNEWEKLKDPVPQFFTKQQLEATVQAEREACAKVCDEIKGWPTEKVIADECAAAIRERSANARARSEK